MRSRLQRWINRVFLTAAAVTALAALALALGLARPCWVNLSRLSVGVVAGDVEVGWGSVPLERTPKLWWLRHPLATGGAMMQRPAGWKPFSSEARVATTTAGTTAVMTLRVTWIPIWPWLAVLTLVTGVTWGFVRREYPVGRCAACGYDLRGLPKGVCPECGVPG